MDRKVDCASLIANIVGVVAVLGAIGALYAPLLM